MPLSLQKRSVIHPQTEMLGWRVGADPPEGGIPRKFKACHCQWLTCFLGVIPPKPPFFFTNKIKFILALKEALKRLYFLLVVRRVSNSFTSSSKTTTQTCGSMGDCCAISRGTWVLAPSSPNFTPEVSFSFLVPLPPSQWAEPGWIRGGECGLWLRLRWPCHWERWVGED